MQGFESLVWVFAFLAAFVFMLLQAFRDIAEKRRREARRRQEGGSDDAPRSADAPPAPSAATPRTPSADEWGRTPSAEDWGRAPPRYSPAPPEPVVLEPVAPVPVVLEIPPRERPAPVRVPLSELPSTIERAADRALERAAERAADRRVDRWATPPARKRPSRRFRHPAEVREGIVALTVLGPCRALAPYGDEEQDPSRLR
ncbi:hypothetical protein JI739_02200 [Ramlibacter sp. AW1]|uniref:Uncharacterized protein n=1 Tax=Ramlibacter aurantiacus TaxID=2801330 RepID=A0A937D081_9BURK|nr:hypothetical protein [Ramlibacter aurantiacus]MBL0419149.1 hypothetical protein [Ramlibacter aurantiacus]